MSAPASIAAPAGIRVASLVVPTVDRSEQDVAIVQVLAPAGRRVVDELKARRWWFDRPRQKARSRVALRLEGAEDPGGLALELEEPLAALGLAPATSGEGVAAAASSGSAVSLGLGLGTGGLGGDAGVRLAVAFLARSSDLATQALPALADHSDRVAHAFGEAGRMAELGVAPSARAVFWRGQADACVGGDAEALGRISHGAERLAPGLTDRLARLRTGVCGRVLEEAGAAAETMLSAAEGLASDRATLVAAHARAALRRYGLTPVEEALVAAALVRAAERGQTLPHRRGLASKSASSQDAPALEATSDVHPEAIELSGVSKRDAHGHGTLCEASLTIRTGEIFGLLGPPGEGRSTLLLIAAGLRLADGGQVRTLGREPSRDRAAIAHDLGVFDGEQPLARDLTVRDAVQLRLSPGEVSADAVLGAAGLLDDAATLVGELDPGRRRRLHIARALVTDPELLLLDDPASGLDPGDREEVLDVIRARGAAGRTVVFTTGSVFDLEAVCDRAALILDGRVAAVGDPTELRDDWFPRRAVLLRTREPVDPAVLDDLPEALAAQVGSDGASFVARIETHQPDALLALLHCDPSFPEIAGVSTDPSDDSRED